MKAAPYLSAVALAVADFFVPELDALLDAFRWTWVSACVLFNANSTPGDMFEPAGA